MGLKTFSLLDAGGNALPRVDFLSVICSTPDPRRIALTSAAALHLQVGSVFTVGTFGVTNCKWFGNRPGDNFFPDTDFGFSVTTRLGDLQLDGFYLLGHAALGGHRATAGGEPAAEPGLAGLAAVACLQSCGQHKQGACGAPSFCCVAMFRAFCDGRVLQAGRDQGAALIGLGPGTAVAQGVAWQCGAAAGAIGAGVGAGVAIVAGALTVTRLPLMTRTVWLP